MDKGGRPSEMSEEKVKKLEEVFAIDGTVEEACFYADISKTTYYNWLGKNPKLVDRFEALRNRPILKARQEVIKGLNNYQNAMDYLKRKKRTEFGDSIDHTTKNKEIKPLLGGMSNGTDNTINNEATETEQED